jgi:acyl carrier protein
MMKLVSFLESEVGYTVEDDELTLQNFESLRSLSTMLEGKGAKLS